MNTMDIKEILDHLPHRYPFLLVDRVVDFEIGKSIHAGLTIGVGFIGIGLVVGLLTDSLGPAAQAMAAQIAGKVPAGLIHDHKDEFVLMAASHFGQEERHRFGTDPRQDQAVHHAVVRTDGAEGVEVFPFEARSDHRA